MTWATVRQIAKLLPETLEGTSYGTAAFHVRGKLLARLKEDGETIVVRSDFADRDVLMRLDPETFFTTDHYLNYPAMLVRLSRVRREQLQELIEGAWRRVAPKRLLQAREGKT